MKLQNLPVVLTIAGSDSGGGAGIQADLKTFLALGTHGTSVITCVTAQNPRAVQSIYPCPARIIEQQLQALFQDLPPRALKIGMLFSKSACQVVASFLRDHPVPTIIDPLILSTSGTPLLERAAFHCLKRQLFPLAALVTPNINEAELLAGQPIQTFEQVRAAAEKINRTFGCPVLIKGGHLPNARLSTDWFFDGKVHLQFKAPFLKGRRLHGAGCTYSAAIAAHLAHGSSLRASIGEAKKYVFECIETIRCARGHQVLNHLPDVKLRKSPAFSRTRLR